MNEIRNADLPRDTKASRGLWLDYLAWSNDELDAWHGFRLPINEALELDLANIAKFQPPSGCILLAIADDEPVGIVCMQRIGPTTAEVKRMYVRPEKRRAGLGRALLEHQIETAKADGYAQRPCPGALLRVAGVGQSQGTGPTRGFSVRLPTR